MRSSSGMLTVVARSACLAAACSALIACAPDAHPAARPTPMAPAPPAAPTAPTAVIAPAAPAPDASDRVPFSADERAAELAFLRDAIRDTYAHLEVMKQQWGVD